MANRRHHSNRPESERRRKSETVARGGGGGKEDLLCARLVYLAMTDVSRVELRLGLILAQPLVTFLGNFVFPLNSAFTMTS